MVIVDVIGFNVFFETGWEHQSGLDLQGKNRYNI